MNKAKRVTLSLPEEMLEAVDRAGTREQRSRSELMREALRWYLGLRELPVEEPTPEETAALAAGRAEHARGEFVTLDEIRRELEADFRAECAEESQKAPS